VIGLGLHDKVRALTGGMGKIGNPKNIIVFDVLTAEELIQKL
jgi:hypothetical protein